MIQLLVNRRDYTRFHEINTEILWFLLPVIEHVCGVRVNGLSQGSRQLSRLGGNLHGNVYGIAQKHLVTGYATIVPATYM